MRPPTPRGVRGRVRWSRCRGRRAGCRSSRTRPAAAVEGDCGGHGGLRFFNRGPSVGALSLSVCGVSVKRQRRCLTPYSWVAAGPICEGLPGFVEGTPAGGVDVGDPVGAEWRDVGCGVAGWRPAGLLELLDDDGGLAFGGGVGGCGVELVGGDKLCFSELEDVLWGGGL